MLPAKSLDFEASSLRPAKLYSNYTNYLYEIPNPIDPEKRFLLFNPSIHYWITLNATGAAIARSLIASGGVVDLEIPGLDVQNDVWPFVDSLVRMRFFCPEMRPGERAWIGSGHAAALSKDYPFEDLILSLGDRCNLACKYCFNAESRGERIAAGTSVRRLTPAEIKRILQEFKTIGGKGVTLTGGEPTLNPAFADYCAEAKDCGLSVNVITNGTTLLRLDWKRLVHVLDSIHVSLDSFDDRTNAELWGVSQHGVGGIIAGLRMAGETARTEGRDLRIVLKPTITRKNLSTLRNLLSSVSEALADCPFAFDIARYEPLGKPEIDQDLTISAAEFEGALSDAMQSYLSSVAPELGNMEIRRRGALFAASHAGKHRTPTRPQALSCVPSLFVTDAGDIYPCQALEIPEFRLGTIYEGSLQDAFSSGPFRQLREAMSRDSIEVCRECELRWVCTDHCHGKSFAAHGKTNAFTGPDTSQCRARVISRLSLETLGGELS
jgi:radical SAM protein with 4Fe4S-binding SPASM domain